MTDHVAHAEVDISASPDQVWDALTDPDKIKQYFFGSIVDSTWQEGDPITWSGEYNGTSFEDKGEVLEVVEPERLKVTHFSPQTGEEDRPENYHALLWELTAEGSSTHVSFTQDNNASAEAAEESTSNWQTMLDGLKELVERG